MPTDRFDFSVLDNGIGHSGFGLAHGPGIDLRPILPDTTPDLIGMDLTHTIHTSDIGAPGEFPAAKGGHGGGPGGGGGGGGGSFADYTAGASGGYNITIQFQGSNWTDALHAEFVKAADRLVSLITGDVPDVKVTGLGKPFVVDDIVVQASLTSIDGVGNILGQAGPTSVRSGSYFPATATMQFDIADAQNYEDQGLFGVIVTHEMLHSVGVGSIWDLKGLVNDAGLFTGAQATHQYELLTGHTEAGVPVEQDGGSGTAGSHWDEETFNDELMTGYINVSVASPNIVLDPLSHMTVASLADLGYQINMNSAQIDGYVLTV
jgi:hypothetical protein